MAELAGITAVEVAGIGPAPRCLRVLADLGARWVRIVPPPGTPRRLPRWYHYGASRGVEQLELDLKRPDAQALFARIAAAADIVVESFRPGVADRLGIGYERLAAVNPRLVYCSITGYGQTGPYAHAAGHDLNYQARAGALAATRAVDGGPALPGLTLADSAGGGWQAALRIVAALLARERTGAGGYLDVAASEGVVQLMSVALEEYFATGAAAAPGATMLHGRYAFYDVYAASDGGWLAVAAIEPKFFAMLCATLGLEELVELQLDDAAQPRIRSALRAAFGRKTRAEWAAIFERCDACVTPVLSLAEVSEDPHWAARGMWTAFDHPEHGPTRQVRPFGAAPGEERGAVPATGAAGAARTLGVLGFADAEIDALRAAGTIA